jgi:hypothetical protein
MGNGEESGRRTQNLDFEDTETSVRFQTSHLEELRRGSPARVGDAHVGDADQRRRATPLPTKGKGRGARNAGRNFRTRWRRCAISESQRRGDRGRMGWWRRSRLLARFRPHSSYVDNHVGRRSLRASMRLRPEDLLRFRRSSSRRSSLIRSSSEALSKARLLRLHTDEGESEGRAKPRVKEKSVIRRGSLGWLTSSKVGALIILQRFPNRFAKRDGGNFRRAAGAGWSKPPGGEDGACDRRLGMVR